MTIENLPTTVFAIRYKLLKALIKRNGWKVKNIVYKEDRRFELTAMEEQNEGDEKLLPRH